MDRLDVDYKSIGVVLMASGFSRRMGKNKLLFPLGKEEKPCIRLVAETLINSGAGEIVVIYQEEGVREVLKDLPVIFVQNLGAKNGQSASVKLGAAHSWKTEIKAIAYCVADQPLLRATDYQRLFKAYLEGETNLVLPCVGEETFSPVIFGRSWQQDLLTLEGDRGGKVLLNSPNAVVKKVPFNEKTIFMDLDTPEDYETLKGLMSSREAWREKT